jgi:hypothetical protein
MAVEQSFLCLKHRPSVSVPDGELDGLDHQQDDRDEQVGAQGEHADLVRERPGRPRQFRQGRHLPRLFLHALRSGSGPLRMRCTSASTSITIKVTTRTNEGLVDPDADEE